MEDFTIDNIINVNQKLIFLFKVFPSFLPYGNNTE